MIGSKKKDRLIPKIFEAKEEPTPQVRRSTREVKSKKDDEFYDQDQLEKIIGLDPSQDDHGGKRHRKSYYYDDFSDFSDNRRPSKKKYRGSQYMCRCPPMNSIQGLLKWREQINNNPIPQPTKENSHIIKVKNICKESLEKYAHGVEALFINIQWNKKNQKIEDVKNLKIQSLKLMPKGLVFIWTPKDLISQIIQLMQRKGFNYVQNLQIGIFDRQKAYQIYKKKNGIQQKVAQPPQTNIKKKQAKKQQQQILSTEQQQQFPFCQVVGCLQNVTPNQLIHKSSYQYFNISKKTLYIFRRNTEDKVELRHQRTCDVVFDMPKNPEGKCQFELKCYLFNMIQTMLPKCLQFGEKQPSNGNSNTKEHKDKEKDKDSKECLKNFKMMQLWGDHDMRRRGWITIVEQ